MFVSLRVNVGGIRIVRDGACDPGTGGMMLICFFGQRLRYEACLGSNSTDEENNDRDMVTETGRRAKAGIG